MTRQDFDKLSYEVLPPKTTHKKCLSALKVFFEKENHPYSSYPASSASGGVMAAGSFRKMPRGNPLATWQHAEGKAHVPCPAQVSSHGHSFSHWFGSLPVLLWLKVFFFNTYV